MILFYSFMVIASSGVMTISMTGWALIPDAIEVDQFKTGQRREGLYVGVILFSRKFSVAIMLWIVGIVLSWSGYVPNQVQTESAILGIRVLYAEGTAFFLLLSVGMAYLLPMTRKRHSALKEAISLKSKGLEWDENSIKDII
jgi:Na+/melibiose symporter-like transporter